MSQIRRSERKKRFLLRNGRARSYGSEISELKLVILCGLIFLCKFLLYFKSSKYDTEHVGYMDHSQSVCALDQTFFNMHCILCLVRQSQAVVL